jgi:SAM-dependent methyltransferase
MNPAEPARARISEMSATRVESKKDFQPAFLSEPDVLIEWANQVRANREQVERLKETEPPADYYAPIAAMFCAYPKRTDEPALEILRSLVEPEDTWLDIGAGAGRYALPIALLAKKVFAIEPSAEMRRVMGREVAEHRMINIDAIDARWPDLSPPPADVALIAHVGYDIEKIGPFLDLMERTASRLCVAVLQASPPTSTVERLWREIHGEKWCALPALPEFLTLLLSRGRLFELRLTERKSWGYSDFDEALRFMYRQLWVSPESAKGEHLRKILPDHLQEKDGKLALNWGPLALGIVTWKPNSNSKPIQFTKGAQ